MDYNHITLFLEKFKKLVFQKEEVKNIITKIISEEINYKIDKDKIKIKNGTIFVEGSPILRSEVMIKKKKILEKLKNFSLNTNIFDIK